VPDPVPDPVLPPPVPEVPLPVPPAVPLLGGAAVLGALGATVPPLLEELELLELLVLAPDEVIG
jgi:hypothetical protein